MSRQNLVLDRPISIVGAARSGTSLLGNILSQHPRIAYWIEPKYIWRYQKPSAPNDRRGKEEATPSVRRYIRSRFTEHVVKEEGRRFMEKTPSNCFRIPFVHAILPEVRIIHLLRDGRDVAFSAREKWTSPPKKEALLRRATSLEIPIRDLPFYAADFLRDVVAREVRPDSGFIWGPQFPGIHEIRDSHSVLETCAIQWRESVLAALEGLETIPEDQRMTVRFERFVRQPSQIVGEICKFLDLSPSSVIKYAEETVHPQAANRWRNRDPDTLAPVMEHAGDLVRGLRSGQLIGVN